MEELDQIVGNAEDDIGDHIADVREREMLYGPNSILGMFGPMVVHICGTPKRYKVCEALTDMLSADRHAFHRIPFSARQRL